MTPTSSVPESLTLTELAGEFAVCRLAPDVDPTSTVSSSHWWSVVRTETELSLVCALADAPIGAEIEAPWRGLTVDGQLDFSLTGILNNLTAPLAAAGIPVFAVSSFDTDTLFVASDDFDQTCEALRSAGYRIALR